MKISRLKKKNDVLNIKKIKNVEGIDFYKVSSEKDLKEMEVFKNDTGVDKR